MVTFTSEEPEPEVWDRVTQEAYPDAVQSQGPLPSAYQEMVKEDSVAPGPAPKSIAVVER